MSRGKKSQQSWAWGPPRHCLLFFCCRDFAEIAAEGKTCCRVGQIFAVPIFGTSKTEKPAFFFVSFFWDVKNSLPYTPVGAEWDAIAIRMGPCAFRWVRKQIQIRSERFPMHPDVCGMGQNMQPQIPIHVGPIWITVASHWTQTGRHAAILTGRHRPTDQAWRNVCSG